MNYTAKNPVNQAKFHDQPEFYANNFSNAFRNIANYFGEYTTRRVKHIFPSYITIAQGANVSESSVRRAIPYFEKIEFFIVLRNNGQRSNEYILNPLFYMQKARDQLAKKLNTFMGKIKDIYINDKKFFLSQQCISNRAFTVSKNMNVDLYTPSPIHINSSTHTPLPNKNINIKETTYVESNLSYLKFNKIGIPPDTGRKPPQQNSFQDENTPKSLTQRLTNSMTNWVGGGWGKENKRQEPTRGGFIKESLVNNEQSSLKSKEEMKRCPSCKGYLWPMAFQTTNSNNLPILETKLFCMPCQS